MSTNNTRAAVLYYAVLVFIGATILLSDWTYQKASDGIYLGTFPLLYLLIAGALIAVSMFDSSRLDNLPATHSFSASGVIKTLLYGGAALVFAFYQDSAGFIPCVGLLAVTGLVLTGERSPVFLALFSAIVAILLYVAFSAFGASITALPNLKSVL